MAGSATLTAVESTAAMAEARIAVMSASCLVRGPACAGHQRRAPLSGRRARNTVRPGRDSRVRLP